MKFRFKQHKLALFFNVILIPSLFALGIYLGTATDYYAVTAIGVGTIIFATLHAHCIYPQRIMIQDGVVTIQSGMRENQVDLDRVSRVFPCKGWAPGQTLGPRMGWVLCLWTRNVFVMPEDEMGFLEEVARQAPHLHRYGNELRSSPIRAIDPENAPLNLQSLSVKDKEPRARKPTEEV